MGMSMKGIYEMQSSCVSRTLLQLSFAITFHYSKGVYVYLSQAVF